MHSNSGGGGTGGEDGSVVGIAIYVHVYIFIYAIVIHEVPPSRSCSICIQDCASRGDKQ